MAQCPKCKRVWNTLPGEEQDHDCPRCGDAYATDRRVDEAIEARHFPCEVSGTKADREYYGRNYK